MGYFREMLATGAVLIEILNMSNKCLHKRCEMRDYSEMLYIGRYLREMLANVNQMRGFLDLPVKLHIFINNGLLCS